MFEACPDTPVQGTGPVATGGNHSDGCPNLWGALCYGLDSLVREHVVDIKHRRSSKGPRHVV